LIGSTVISGLKREARLRADVPVIHVFSSSESEDVDGWDKPGHDDSSRIVAKSPGATQGFFHSINYSRVTRRG
jgi:hypothetical protein